jgi:small nuclear ribonucleoprotein (snRNP)-like protein
MSMTEPNVTKNAVYRRVNVKTLDGSVLNGKVNIGSDGRASDLFARTDQPFVVMVDVQVEDALHKTLFINKNHIVWVEPED